METWFIDASIENGVGRFRWMDGWMDGRVDVDLYMLYTTFCIFNFYFRMKSQYVKV